MTVPTAAPAGRLLPQSSIKGIALMLLAVFLFAGSDVLGKWLIAGYPLGEILLVRSIAALALLAPFLLRGGAAAIRQAPQPGLQLARALLALAEVSCFYLSVAGLPLADALTYYLAGPIYVTALSAVFLRERVGWRRWSAVLAGFAGVVVALDPSGQPIGGPALIALAGSVAFSVLMIVTRRLRGTSETALSAFPLTAAVVFGAAGAPFAWVAPTGFDLLLLVLVGVVSTSGLLCLNRSLRLADASVVAPYQYTMIVWAMIAGYLVFGDVPRASTVIGAAIIVGAGLFIFLRERQLERRAA